MDWATDNEIKEWLNKGRSGKEIRAKLKVGSARVAKLAAEHSRLNRKKIAEKVYAMYDNGNSIGLIVTKLHVSIKVIKSMLKEREEGPRPIPPQVELFDGRARYCKCPICKCMVKLPCLACQVRSLKNG